MLICLSLTFIIQSHADPFSILNHPRSSIIWRQAMLLYLSSNHFNHQVANRANLSLTNSSYPPILSMACSSKIPNHQASNNASYSFQNSLYPPFSSMFLQISQSWRIKQCQKSPQTPPISPISSKIFNNSESINLSSNLAHAPPRSSIIKHLCFIKQCKFSLKNFL